MRNFAHGILLAALVMAGGGHSAVLQAVAWTGMIIRFSQEDDLVVSLQRTFSGAEPCPLCRFVTEQERHDSGDTPREEFPRVRPIDLYPSEDPELPDPVKGTLTYHGLASSRTIPPQADPLLKPPQGC